MSQHPQLRALHHDLDETERRAHALAAAAGAEGWMTAPAQGRWSPSECVQHLITTIDAFIPLVDAALDQATRPAPPTHGPFVPDLMGRLLLWVLEPPYRMRSPTGAAFVPAKARPAEVDLAEFVGRHEQWRSRMRRADGYALDKVRIRSPFVTWTTYSLYTTFRIVPTHERRHLWQGERALDALAARGA